MFFFQINPCEQVHRFGQIIKVTALLIRTYKPLTVPYVLYCLQGGLLLFPDRAVQELRSARVERRREELPLEGWSSEPTSRVSLY